MSDDRPQRGSAAFELPRKIDLYSDFGDIATRQAGIIREHADADTPRQQDTFGARRPADLIRHARSLVAISTFARRKE